MGVSELADWQAQRRTDEPVKENSRKQQFRDALSAVLRCADQGDDNSIFQARAANGKQLEDAVTEFRSPDLDDPRAATRGNDRPALTSKGIAGHLAPTHYRMEDPGRQNLLVFKHPLPTMILSIFHSARPQAGTASVRK